jgi:hypothetical protein
MKNWVGKWLMFVSIGHTTVSVMLFSSIYKDMFLDGLFNTVHDESTASASWFLLFGFLLFILAWMIYVFEKKAVEIPKIIGVLLFSLTTLGVILMPLSGFWLVYPAALFIILKLGQRKGEHYVES